MLKKNPKEISSINYDFLVGVLLMIGAIVIVTVPFQKSSQIEYKVLSSFLGSLFGVSAIASFRRAGY